MGDLVSTLGDCGGDTVATAPGPDRPGGLRLLRQDPIGSGARPDVAGAGTRMASRTASDTVESLALPAVSTIDSGRRKAQAQQAAAG
jgi:hypothetical protein